MKTASLILGVVVLALFAGCSTPETRIQKNPEIFSKLPPNDQQLIREGKVGIGFTPDMVKLALGDPDRVYARIDAQGSNESWSYTTYESDDGVPLYRGYYHRYYGYGGYAGWGYGGWGGPWGGWGGPSPLYYMDFPSRRAHEYLKVVFKDGVVSTIEQRT